MAIKEKQSRKIHLGRNRAFALLAFNAVLLELAASTMDTKILDIDWIDLSPRDMTQYDNLEFGFDGLAKLADGETLGVGMAVKAEKRECHVAIASPARDRSWGFLVFFDPVNRLIVANLTES
jgi:hypothetical protein